ncbi:MAG: DedA family protein [Bdellovibrionales bacterium]|nr:DedA family protein [Bdellovibrionales bacterium]
MTDTEQTPVKSKMLIMIWLRKTYDWVLGWSEHPRGEWALYFFSAIEAIFFPIPVDPILVAMGAGRPKKALRYALFTTIFSVAGACVGYYLGAVFWESTQSFFFQHVFSPAKFDKVMALFRENGALAIVVAGFTPLPYKVFAVSAGVANVSLPVFVAASLVGRAGRFMVLGALIYKFGPEVRKQIDLHFERITIIVGLLLLLFFVVYKVLF